MRSRHVRVLAGWVWLSALAACETAEREAARDAGERTNERVDAAAASDVDASDVDASAGRDAGSVTVSDAGSVTPDGGSDAPPDAGTDPPLDPPASRVLPIYIAATDNTEAEIEARRVVFTHVFRGVQQWYAEVMGVPYDRATFYVEPVRVLRGHYSEAEWARFGARGFADDPRSAADGTCAMWYGALHELEARGLRAANGLPPLGSGVFYYVVLGGGDNGSCGARNYLAASEASVLDDAARDCPTGRFAAGATTCRAPGVVAHESGHGFGLPHASDRPRCTGGPSIMDLWWDYDRGPTLCDEDRAELAASPYFAWRVR